MTNTLLAVLFILLTLVISCDARSRTGWTSSRVRRVSIDVDSPCPLLTSSFKKSTYKPHKSSHKAAIDLYNVQSKYVCDDIFETGITIILDELSACHKQRNKRQALELITSGIKLAAGVTDFVTAITSRNADTNEAVNKASDNILMDLPVQRAKEVKEIESSEKTSSHHIETIIEIENELAPPPIWTSFHIFRKLMAGLANLREVSKQCERNQLATDEIGELIGDETFGEIDPLTTRIVRVDVNNEEKIIDIYFEIVEQNEEGGLSLIAIFIVVALLALLLVVIIITGCIVLVRPGSSSFNRSFLLNDFCRSQGKLVGI